MNGITDLLWKGISIGQMTARESANKKNLVLETPEKVGISLAVIFFGDLVLVTLTKEES